METDSKSESIAPIRTSGKHSHNFALPADPKNPADMDRATKMRIQKERQTQALLLVKQVTGLLQRTRLNITVTCQAIHSKNARHMMLGGWLFVKGYGRRPNRMTFSDLIDYLEPTMVIVGSRGLGKLKGCVAASFF
jgi:hypothetical protein